MNILISSAGQRVSLVRAFKDQVAELCVNGKIYATDIAPELSAACNVADKFFKVSRVNSNGYIDEMLDLCKTNDIRMIIPTIDTELLLLAASRKTFQENGVEIIVSDLNFVKKCRDKRETNRFFEESGIETPAQVDKTNPTFPLFIKPFDGS